MTARGLGLVVLALQLGACAYYTRPTREICVARATATQSVGRLNAIGEQVLSIQAAACREGRVSKAECERAEALRTDLRTAQRDAQAAVMTPGYEISWDHVAKTLEAVGRVLDSIPPR